MFLVKKFDLFPFHCGNIFSRRSVHQQITCTSVPQSPQNIVGTPDPSPLDSRGRATPLSLRSSLFSGRSFSLDPHIFQTRASLCHPSPGSSVRTAQPFNQDPSDPPFYDSSPSASARPPPPTWSFQKMLAAPPPSLARPSGGSCRVPPAGFEWAREVERGASLLCVTDPPDPAHARGPMDVPLFDGGSCLSCKVEQNGRELICHFL